MVISSDKSFAIFSERVGNVGGYYWFSDKQIVNYALGSAANREGHCMLTTSEMGFT